MPIHRAIYPGTFDIFTNGHLDITRRALAIFGTVVIGVAPSDFKKPLFSIEERVDMIKTATKGMDGITVLAFDCLLAEFVKKMNAKIIIRGLRAISDYEYELQLALMNRKLYPELETVMLVPESEYSFISSSLVKQVAEYGGEIRDFVPGQIAEKVYQRLKERKP